MVSRGGVTFSVPARQLPVQSRRPSRRILPGGTPVDYTRLYTSTQGQRHSNGSPSDGESLQLSRTIIRADFSHCPRQSADHATRSLSAVHGDRIGRSTSLRTAGLGRLRATRSSRSQTRSPRSPRVTLTAPTPQSSRSGSDRISCQSDCPSMG